MVPNRRPYREIARVAESPRRSRGAQNHHTINIYTSNIYHPQHMCIYTYIHVEREILTWLADSSINHPSISHASLLEIRKAFIEVQLVNQEFRCSPERLLLQRVRISRCCVQCRDYEDSSSRACLTRALIISRCA